MRIHNNLKRIFCFTINHRKELFTYEFWITVKRVFRERFNYLDRIPSLEFWQNLRRLEIRPWNLHIELTNICNANCIFCAYQFQTRKKIIMDSKVYVKSLDDYCSIGGGELMLKTCVGDPLIDPDFINRILQVRLRPEITKISTITNGINLDKAGIEKLLQSGINEVSISTGPWDEKLYQLVYNSKEYHKVRQNITQLLKMNLDMGAPVSIKICFRSNLGDYLLPNTVSEFDYRTASLGSRHSHCVLATGEVA